ncbi:MAG TPA: D-alanine--D-alanine ligase [Phycisphaerae bacterium]|nr:D-alanine--D-alanine ligase [Phycisphaerae bacterium]HRY67037.1 D-alanine--D-alanine ligase [Phycisphaerae bacterium]HSA27734.1 D-alanine--D-alanine ligase [Phycisphaerae bacterium]
MTRLADQAASRMVMSNTLARQAAPRLPLRELAAPPRFSEVPIVARKLKITVLSGGPSSERQVSLKSGRAVATALQSLSHDVTLADIAPDHLEALDVPVDMVFIALHGSFGEDGQLQRILDDRGITYCGSGAASSQLAMNKVAAKAQFIHAGVPTPRFDVVGSDRVDRVLGHWSAPVVLKPIAEGSSVDCELVRDSKDLRGALVRLAGRYGQCLVEEYVRGPELTVGVLGDEALPPIQIRTKRELYDYQAKYLDNDTEYLFDIDLPPEVLENVCALSVKAHRSLGCRDFSRVDWMIDGRTHQPYALEVNTIPGFTDHSLLPKAAARAGLSFAGLCQRIVELTCRRMGG